MELIGNQLMRISAVVLGRIKRKKTRIINLHASEPATNWQGGMKKLPQCIRYIF